MHILNNRCRLPRILGWAKYAEAVREVQGVLLLYLKDHGMVKTPHRESKLAKTLWWGLSSTIQGDILRSKIAGNFVTMSAGSSDAASPLRYHHIEQYIHNAGLVDQSLDKNFLLQDVSWSWPTTLISKSNWFLNSSLQTIHKCPLF